ncbi:hypothetical protein, partial [Methylobacterium variabile]|uniref:hypothetical protein n=1 Tax=Methylobacterium variabile TaxID=298794 RepID=UPI001ADF6AE3
PNRASVRGQAFRAVATDCPAQDVSGGHQRLRFGHHPVEDRGDLFAQSVFRRRIAGSSGERGTKGRSTGAVAVRSLASGSSRIQAPSVSPTGSYRAGLFIQIA